MANKDIFAREKNDELVLKLRINQRNIERALFIIIILILSYLAFFGSGACETGMADNEKIDATTETIVQENATAEKEELEEEPIIIIEEEPEVVIEEEPEVIVEEESETEELEVTEIEEVEYDGQIHLVIDELETETGTYETSEVDWGKISGVTFTIDNQKDDFMPKIEVFTYNSDSSTLMKKKVRAEIIYSTQELGEKKQHSLDVDCQPFTDLDEPATLKIVMRDKDTNEVLQTIEKEYDFS